MEKKSLLLCLFVAPREAVEVAREGSHWLLDR